MKLFQFSLAILDRCLLPDTCHFVNGPEHNPEYTRNLHRLKITAPKLKPMTKFLMALAITNRQTRLQMVKNRVKLFQMLIGSELRYLFTYGFVPLRDSCF